MKHPHGTSFTVETKIRKVVESLCDVSPEPHYLTAPFNHPGYRKRFKSGVALEAGNFVHGSFVHGLSEPFPFLSIGELVNITFTLIVDEKFFVPRMWQMKWEPVPFEHSDLYGSGYEGYEYED